MTRNQIDNLVSHRAVPETEKVIQTIETFISWVIICERFTYKIKRPVRYSFLNFSTVERRKNFCLQEYYLNKQLAGDIYIDVLPVTVGDGLRVGGNGDVIDYAVRMRTMDNEKLMSVLLPDGRVDTKYIDDLAMIIADFHIRTRTIYRHANYDLTEKFNDILGQTKFLAGFLPAEDINGVHESVELFGKLSTGFTSRLIKRVNLGFFRDCHGDLHSGNVFLMNKPIPFDRIEFDHELREIDVLNEIAFMCMDLEYFGKPDLSQQFFETYNTLFPTVLTEEDENLFLLYKAYRANVCAKVNSLKAQGAIDAEQRLSFLKKTKKYLGIMSVYLARLNRTNASEFRNPTPSHRRVIMINYHYNNTH